MAQISLKGINKVYPNGVQAVFDFNLEIENKDFIVLVGPSGCGKSTTLRMIAGLEDITSGELYINGEYMNDVAPKNRGIAMVFQSYALYPHMTVYQNMAFALKIRKFPKDEIKRRVDEAASILGLEPYLDRKPKALSGGQRQRVALGRAIVRDSRVFLFDEPLSNLDAKLRVQMRAEISKLHKRLDATSIYVTHDQIEAMTMATKIVVMKDGFIQQIGSPIEIYNNPKNMFVGGFIGTPPMNFIHGMVDEDGWFFTKNNSIRVKVPEGKLTILKDKNYIQKEIVFGIRPEHIYDNEVVFLTYPDSIINVKIDIAELLGSKSIIYSTVDGDEFTASVEPRNNIEPDEYIKLVIDMNKVHFFDVDTTLEIE